MEYVICADTQNSHHVLYHMITVHRYERCSVVLWSLDNKLVQNVLRFFYLNTSNLLTVMAYYTYSIAWPSIEGHAYGADLLSHVL